MLKLVVLNPDPKPDLFKQITGMIAVMDEISAADVVKTAIKNRDARIAALKNSIE